MKFKMKCVGVRYMVMTERYLERGRLQLMITVMITCHFDNNNNTIYLFRVELLARTLFYIILHNLFIKYDIRNKMCV